jgi:DNA-binding transcriptional ArsR family regulator
MSEPTAEHMNGLNRVIHEPVRLAILKVLETAREVDFSFLLGTLGLTKGNLATHINTLEAAGYVAVSKEFVGKIPRTTYRLTRLGRQEFEKHWKHLIKFAP